MTMFIPATEACTIWRKPSITLWNAAQAWTSVEIVRIINGTRADGITVHKAPW